MAYGFRSYTSDGKIQFTSEDPALYTRTGTGYPAAGEASITKANSSPDIDRYRSNNVFAATPSNGSNTFNYTTDAVIAKPTSGSGSDDPKGFLGLFPQSTTACYWYGGGSFGCQIDGNTLTGNNYCKWKIIKDASDLTASTSGYGLTVWDGGSPQKITFTSHPSGNYDGWLSMVSVTPKGTSLTANEGRKLIYTSDANEWPYLYGVYTGGRVCSFKAQYDTSPYPLEPGKKDVYLNFDAYGALYFDNSTYEVYVYQGNWSYTQIGYTGTNNDSNFNMTPVTSHATTLSYDVLLARIF